MTLNPVAPVAFMTAAPSFFNAENTAGAMSQDTSSMSL